MNKSEDDVYEMNYIASLNWMAAINQREEVKRNKMKEKNGSSY